ncbi:hypothetical protein RUM43_003548 [Polyplax serrata]|uniref:Pre-mRNA-splicing factor 18 n=1 Tax=Polyplax serrata TaxID=468196 RepID=A0AAN8NWX5_POLSC
MDVLKAEIIKKRKLLEEKKVIEPAKKFFKRGELIAKEDAEYLQKFAPETNNPTCSKNPIESSVQKQEDGSDHAALPRKEVIRRLRDRGEPILLFGEAEVEAFHRLRKCEILEPEVNKGFRNDFQEALEKVDQAFLDEIIASQQEDEGKSNLDVKVLNDDGITYDEIKNKATELGKGNREQDLQLIYQFLQFLLKMWGNQLNNRTPREKQTTKGKLASATFTQTQIYLKPLLRKLKTISVPEDISDSLTEIVAFLLDRNYIKANDSYLQMAIGNAPWPIGVTMVGIHARTGREKIFSKNVAHVLNDETQRKYIQALKRLMTKCQQFFPTDPSRCVEYAAFGPLS